MNDDSLSAVWTSDRPASKAAIMAAVNAVLEEDRAVRDKQRWIRRASLLAIAVLCPVLLWCAAFGITPLVRGGYALMAAGTAMIVALEWVYLAWSRDALPGAVDARSQLQKTGFLLSRQANLLTTAPLWSAPIFVGTMLIGMWVYQERSHIAAYLLWALTATCWFSSWVASRSRVVTLLERRARLEQSLRDLE